MLTWLVVLAALAQSPPPNVLPPGATAAEPPPGASIGASLPVFEAGLPPAWPPGALAEGQEASVRLELDVLEDGTVAHARVVEPIGGGFDEAAIAAALTFTFTPARDAAGQVASARILWELPFTIASAQPLSVEGEITDADGLPAPGAILTLTSATGAWTTRADADGRFRIAGLAPGSWGLGVAASGLTPADARFEVAADRVATVSLALAPRDPGAADEIVVLGARAEVAQRELRAEEIRVLPGANGDAVKAVQNLPGVSRAPFDIGQLILRGMAPEDSGAYLDGQRLPLVFHFAGLSTILNADLLDEVVLLPGGYGARYGRTLGGVVDLRSDRQLPEEDLRYASVDLFQATAFVRQRVSERTAITVSARRSYIDAVLNPVLSNSDRTLRAPRYFDFQARVLHRFDDGATLDAMFFNSYDKFVILGSESDGEAEQAALSFGAWLEKGRIAYERPLGGAWRSETSLLVGPEIQEFSLGAAGEAYERPFFASLRHEIARPPVQGGAIGVKLGADVLGARYAYVYDLEAFDTVEKDAAWSIQPALYGEATVDRGPLVITPGLRLDPWLLQGGYSLLTLDPRLSARWSVGPSTTVIGQVGRYSQAPTPRQVLKGTDGNPDLTSTWAVQSSLGIIQRAGDRLTIEATAFDSQLRDLVSGREDAFRFFTGPPPTGPLDTGAYANDGAGVTRGIESLVRYRSDDTVAWLSATLSRSTRTKRPGQEPVVFTYDQPLVLTAVATHAFNPKWRLGGRARYASGSPYTEVVNRSYDLDARAFVPVYGDPGGARLPAFWAIDVRVDRTWSFERWELTAYLDLQNATNHGNVDVMGWTWDYEQEAPITGFPTLPVIGARGEF